MGEGAGDTNGDTNGDLNVFSFRGNIGGGVITGEGVAGVSTNEVKANLSRGKSYDTPTTLQQYIISYV